MITPLSPETLAWLHQAAAAGVAEPMVLRHVMERLDALEAADRLDAEAWASMRRANCDHQRRLLILEAAQQQPVGYARAVEDTLKTGIGIDNVAASAGRFVREQPAPQPTPPVAPAATEMVTAPEAAPEATDDELFDLFHQHDPLGIVLRAIYNLGRQHGAAQLPAAKSDLEPTPPAAPAGGLLQEVALIVASDSGEGLESFIGIAKAVIYAMAAWLDLEGYVRAANDLREEVGQ